MIWEMLNNVSIDAKMLKSGFSIPLAAYFLSRYLSCFHHLKSDRRPRDRFTMLAFLIGVVVINSQSTAVKSQLKENINARAYQQRHPSETVPT